MRLGEPKTPLYIMENNITILLDAGHDGKYNQSPVVSAYFESDFAWKYHLMLKEELESYGIKVVLTRKTQDEELEVTKRGKKAKNCTVALSVHSNASSDAEKDRVAIYCQLKDPSDGEHTEKSRRLAEHIAPVINKVMECVGQYKIDTRESSLDRDGDGTKDDYYGFLRGAACVKTPALILEHSYHTNERATKWLLDDNNLARMAFDTAHAIANFYGVIGDIDGDGNITTTDYLMAKRIALGTYCPSPVQLKRCDINGDGKITAVDYIMLKRRILNESELGN